MHCGAYIVKFAASSSRTGTGNILDLANKINEKDMTTQMLED
jgi:hypothetical protein